MSLNLKRKSLLKALLFILFFVVIGTFLIFYLIRNEEIKKTNSTIDQLKQIDPKSVMVEKCFHYIYQADNHFKLYSLSYDSANYAQYKEQIDSLIQTLDTLKTSFSANPEEDQFVQGAHVSIAKKIDISASFVKLKRLTDSLLFVAYKIDSINVNSKIKYRTGIRKIDPALLQTMIDTMNVFTTSSKSKKGILGKIKTFIAGGTEEVTTQHQMAISSKDSMAAAPADTATEYAYYTDVIASKTDNYYQKQLRIQKINREKLAAKEKMLVQTNNDLMANINQILNTLKEQIDQAHNSEKEDALNTIANTTKKLGNTSLLSIGILLFLIMMILLVLRQLIRVDNSGKEKLIKHLEYSEEKYRNLIESATDSIFIVKNGTIEYVNQVLIQLSGYKENEIIGKSFINFVSSNDRQMVAEFYKKRMNGETVPFTYESSAILNDGTEIPVEVTTSVFNYFGDVAELVFCRDIRDKKEAESQILESKVSFENLFENSPVSIWEEDITAVMQRIEQLKKSGISNFEEYLNEHPLELVHFTELTKVLRINKETLTIYQAETKEELFSNINKTFLPESFDVFKAEIIALAKGETKIEEKTKVKSLKGNILDVMVRMFTLKVEEKQIAYLTTIDITKLSEAEAEIRKLNEELEIRVKERTAQLEAVNRDLESFAYSISHDLRTPLRHIDAFTKIIKESIPDRTTEMERYFNKVNESSSKMTNMIDHLLDFSRLGRKNLVKTEVDLNKIIDQVIGSFSSDCENRAVEWKIQKLPVIQGDFNLLHLVFENLISNALKFTSRNEKTVIEIGKCGETDQCSFFVKDNGVGFDMKYSEKLFGVFQRLHNQDEFEGIGIGLANIKQIIQKHGGSIKAHGELHQGATFYIYL